MQSVNHEQTHEEMSWTVQIRRIVLTMLAALLGVAAGLGALVGTAAITGRPPMFLLSGLAAFCAAYFLGILLATRGISSCNRQRVRTILFWVGTAVLVGVFVWTALLHMDDRRLPPASVAGQRFW